MQLRVFHGSVDVLGCALRPDGEWHQIISDPRKNMLLDIKNTSKELEVSDYKVILDDKTKIKLGDLQEEATVIAIREFTKYSEAEE